MKHSVKGTDNWPWIRIFEENVPKCDAEIKEGMFIGRQIWELMQDKQFDEYLNETKRNTLLSFKGIFKYILWNHKGANYQDAVEDLLTS